MFCKFILIKYEEISLIFILYSETYRDYLENSELSQIYTK
jgi:hypothetical protein